MPLTSEQLVYFKDRLLKEKARLTEELKSLGHKDKEGRFEATYPETGGNSEDDNSMEMTELVDNEAIVGRLESDLRDVEKALKA
ncbi:MAG: hypothetical protein NUV42_00200, partial [Candidatus Yonathbacteria bacterium]|nr:hypothetical protein [Candidatus Yonathbacteria bacterium]